MHDAPQSNRPSGRPRSRLPLLVAPAAERFNGPHRGPIGAAGPRPRAGRGRSDYRRSAGAAKQRLGGAQLHTWRVWNTWRVWRLREGFSRSERAARYQSTLFGRRAAQQRGAIAAALHGADGALGLLDPRAQGLARAGGDPPPPPTDPHPAPPPPRV